MISGYGAASGVHVLSGLMYANGGLPEVLLSVEADGEHDFNLIQATRLPLVTRRGSSTALKILARATGLSCCPGSHEAGPSQSERGTLRQ
jgi:hypothetical protein